METEEAANRDEQVTVKVFAPRKAEPKEFTWSLHRKVGATAREAAHAFEYVGGDPTFGHDGRTFERDKTLGEERVHEHEHLELLDVGGGV